MELGSFAKSPLEKSANSIHVLITMAIYQYYLAVIPTAGLLKIHDRIPASIHVSTESGYFETDAERYWKAAEVDSSELRTQIDQIVNFAEVYQGKFLCWKTHTEKVDNDAAMVIDENTGHITEFSFRADLREEKLLFLRNMLHLGQKYAWQFMDRRGKLWPPDFEKLREGIKISNPYRFLTDPIKFLESLPDNPQKGADTSS